MNHKKLFQFSVQKTFKKGKYLNVHHAKVTLFLFEYYRI